LGGGGEFSRDLRRACVHPGAMDGRHALPTGRNLVRDAGKARRARERRGRDEE